VFGVIFVAFILGGLIAELPILIGRDQSIVANNDAVQKMIFERILSEEFLTRVQALQRTAAVYDKSATKEEKIQIAKIMATQILDILSGKIGLLNYPVGKVNIFSSAIPIDKNNLLEVPSLLITKIQSGSGGSTITYVPRLYSPTPHDQNEFLLVNEWLNQKIVKDVQGKLWTRKSLLEAESKNINEGALATAPDLQAFRKEKAWSSTQEIYYTNSVETESIRSIAGETLQAIGLIKESVGIADSNTIPQDIKLPSEINLPLKFEKK